MSVGWSNVFRESMYWERVLSTCISFGIDHNHSRGALEKGDFLKNRYCNDTLRPKTGKTKISKESP